jgi:hypothetical protein
LLGLLSTLAGERLMQTIDDMMMAKRKTEVLGGIPALLLWSQFICVDDNC